MNRREFLKAALAAPAVVVTSGIATSKVTESTTVSYSASTSASTSTTTSWVGHDLKHMSGTTPWYGYGWPNPAQPTVKGVTPMSWGGAKIGEQQ